MNSTQIKNPKRYILGGLSGLLLGALLLYFLEHILQAPDRVNLIYRQMHLAFYVYGIMLISLWVFLRGLSLAYHLRRYEKMDVERP